MLERDLASCSQLAFLCAFVRTAATSQPHGWSQLAEIRSKPALKLFSVLGKVVQTFFIARTFFGRPTDRSEAAVSRTSEDQFVAGEGEGQ
jgi:hypothetical protein